MKVTLAVIAVGLVLESGVAGAESQRSRAPGSGGGSATRGGSGATQQPATAEPRSALIEDREFRVRRDQLEALTQQLAASKSTQPPAKSSRFGLSTLTKALSGDENRETAGRILVRRQARLESANGAKTVIVVVGNESERAKVRESLAEVQRPVVLLYVDTGFTDASFDNQALQSGLLDKTTGSATNVWVFLPRPGAAPDKEPDQVLSTRIVSPKVWTGFFVTDGDLPAQASNFVAGRRNEQTQATAAVAPSQSPTPASATAIAVGDIVTSKIAGLRLLESPADNGKPVGTLTKTDELVVIEPEKGGFVRVQGAATAGWIRSTMLTKKP